ncbi:alginate export family protein, partial [Alteromonas stellipolaris]
MLACFSAPSFAQSWHDVLSEASAWADLNLRYESVDQDNALDDASALTLRTRLGFKSGTLNGFSFTAEVEDSRIVMGQGDYTVGPTGYNVGEYSVIADPETTEVDQAFIQYKNEKLTLKGGRQVIALDNHRFVGHVGWRQDRQTFDGVTATYAFNEKVNFFYGYLTQRNRIFAEAADFDSKDHLFNASFKTAVGKFTAYGYLLEIDNDTDN